MAIQVYVSAALLLLAAGAAVGFLAVISLGIRREERAFSLTTDTTGALTRGTRRVIGVYCRSAEPTDRDMGQAAGKVLAGR